MKESITKLAAFKIGIENELITGHNIKRMIDKIDKLNGPEKGKNNYENNYVYLDDVQNMYENELKDLLKE